MLEVAPKPADATHLSDRQLKAVRGTGKNFVLGDGDGLLLQVRASGSMMWNFNYCKPPPPPRQRFTLANRRPVIHISNFAALTQLH